MKRLLLLALLIHAFHLCVFAQLTVVLSSDDVTATTAGLEANFTDLPNGETSYFIQFKYRVQGSGSAYSNSDGAPYNVTAPDDYSSYTTLSGLSQSTVYEYYVRYRYDGAYYNTDLSTFTTTAYTSASVVTDNATDILGTSATLNGLVLMGSTVPLEDVHFEWGTTVSYGNTTPNNDVGSDSDVSAGISGLTSGTTYHFRIVATDLSSGTPETLYGDDKQFATGDAPLITGFSNHETDEFDIAWSFSGTASTYYLDIATDAAFTSMLAGYSNLNTGNVTSYNVSGCAAGTVYYARVRAKLSSGGTTGSSATDNTITICDAPTAIAASAIGGSLFTANWDAETGASSYLLDVSLTNTFLTFVGVYNDYEVAGGATISQVVSSLTPNTDYYYRLRAKNSSGNSDYSNIIGPVTTLNPIEVEWTGLTDNVWNESGNWEYNVVPTSSIAAVIPSAPANQPTLYANGTAKSITIEAGASIYVRRSKVLTVSNGDLLIEATSSETGEIGLARSASVVISSGNARFQQYIPGNRWVFVSVPVSGVTGDDFFLNHAPEVYLSTYNEDGGHPGTDTYCEACWSYIEDLSTGINAMQGYKMWIVGSSNTYEFSASNFNSGTVSRSLSVSGSTSSGYGWNLIGNPYPSHIDWDAVDKTGLQNNGYYAWNGSAFLAYNNGLGTGLGAASRYVPPFQGFFVRASVNGTSFAVKDDYRVISSSTHYKQSDTIPDYMRLTIHKEGAAELYDDIIVRFLSDANEDYDRIGDAYKMYGNYDIPQLFTYIEDGTELAMNALPPEMKEEAIVPMGVFVTIDGVYNFTATEMESFQHQIPIKVRDLQTGDVFDLIENPTFTVELDSGYYRDRFEILFGENTAIQEFTANGNRVKINSDNQCINITVLGDNSVSAGTLQASVYDMTGRQVLSQQVNKKGLTRIYLQQSSGWYVVRVIGSNINKVEKVFFKKN